jgi:hypothetical protein
MGIFPIGESLANQFARKGSVFWLLLFGFLVGFATTAAEPALIAIADRAETISAGRLDAFWLRITVALSVGLALMVGILRILLGHPIHYYIITGYLIVILVTFFAPAEIVGLAYDSGGVTTSTVTVPLVAALGVGLASSIRGRNPVIDGFGLIAFASMTPMIFVQVFGIIVYQLTDPVSGQAAADGVAGAAGMAGSGPAAEPEAGSAVAQQLDPGVMLSDLLGVVRDIIPIIAVIAFFQYGVVRQPIAHLHKVAGGFALVIIGLYAFILGLNLGLFPIGESMAFQLTRGDGVLAIYAFAFLIGFSTTMAEPSLIAIADKAREVSSERINALILRVFVATGVAVGITLGCHRIIAGDSIQYYIMVGYLGVVVLTYFAPRYIIPIAYDSGGVTTSTVTVPLVAALGLGLAANLEGRSPLLDGFGLIAFASLFPMLTVMSYGLIAERLTRRQEETP